MSWDGDTKQPPCPLQETKAKALQEELENPMNVHRWRKLEGSDPAMYELIQKAGSAEWLHRLDFWCCRIQWIGLRENFNRKT